MFKHDLLVCYQESHRSLLSESYLESYYIAQEITKRDGWKRNRLDMKGLLINF